MKRAAVTTLGLLALLAFAPRAGAQRFQGHGGFHGGGFHGGPPHGAFGRPGFRPGFRSHVFVGGFFWDPFFFPGFYPYPYYYPYPVYSYPPYPPPPPPEQAGSEPPPNEQPPPSAEASPTEENPLDASYGLVQLRGVPDGADVDLDGRFWITAQDLDKRWLAVPRGSHTIVVRVPGMAPAERRIEVEPGKSQSVRFGPFRAGNG